jgi:hypothetical protein
VARVAEQNDDQDTSAGEITEGEVVQPVAQDTTDGDAQE